MRVTKKEILIDLRYCKESLDRIIKHADKNFRDDSYLGNHHTVIQKDIIKLRRELNEIRQKLQWDYEE